MRRDFFLKTIATACIVLVINSCVTLPNLDPGNGNSTMCVIEVGLPINELTSGLDINEDNILDIFTGNENYLFWGFISVTEDYLEIANGDILTETDLENLLRDKLFRLGLGQLVGGNFGLTSWQFNRGWFTRISENTIFPLTTPLDYEYLCPASTCIVRKGSGAATGGGFVAFRFNLPDGLHYGWVELSQDIFCDYYSCTITTIVERVAYNKTANRAVRIGEY